jgi:hypothetical protein
MEVIRIRTPEELRQRALDELACLRDRIEAFDRGVLRETPSMSVHICNLVLDMRGTKSILTQLGVRDDVKFMSTGRCNHPNAPSEETPLIMVQMGQTRVIARSLGPPREGTDRFVDFSTWWEEELIFRDVNKASLTRKELVMSFRDQGGGAHLDPTTDIEANRGLREGNTVGLRLVEPDGGLRTVELLHYTMMRQVAYEVIHSQLPGIVAP